MNEEAPTYNRWFWIGLALAVPVLAYGIRGALEELPGVQLTSFLRYFVGGALVHDIVIGPVVCVVGWVLARRLPRDSVVPVQGALASSAIVSLVSWPLLRGYGATAGEPSFLSRNYATSLVVTLAVIWTVALGTVVVRRLNARGLNVRRR